jgi:RNA polymerase sigma factor (sigma-70 family)
MMARTRNLPAYRHYRVLFEVGSFSGLTDGELLARFVSREEQSAELAFTAIVERHASKVLRICRGVVRNAHDAEDAFQATFLVLASKAAKLQAHESLGPWLFAVARRVAAGARARALGREARERRAAGDRAKAHFPHPIEDDVSAVLYEEIDRLPERYRLPVVLCDLESQSHQEAARRLGWPLGTVKSRQARGRQRLRARLTRRGVSGTLGAMAAACAGRSARAVVPASLIESTASIAANFMMSGAAGRVVSASVSTLVTNTLRAMIMLRLSKAVGVLLTVSVGLVATVLAQTMPKQATPSNNFAPSNYFPEPKPSPVPASFEYEIRIWKNGAPVTPMIKLKAIPREASGFTIPEGTVELRFQPAATMSQPVSDLSLQSKLLHELSRTKVAPVNPQSQNNPADLRNEVETLYNSLTNLRAIGKDEAGQLGELLARIGPDKSAPDKKDHEHRLLEIERKLERILSVLDQSAAKRPEPTGTDPRPK